MSAHARWLFALKLACLAAALLLPAVPQPAGYHDFADTRALLGVPNAADVLSNVAFVVAGLGGLAATLGRGARFASRGERLPYAVFFAGVALTGLGSAHYHLAPDNERLFWDRLPMAVAFMGLVAAQIADRVGARAGLALLGPLLALGVASVVHWRATERLGTGNVVPYAVLQAYAVFVLLLLASFARSRYTHGVLLFHVFAWYAVAKLAEALDREVFAATGLASGHTLKHLAAAAAVAVVWRMLVVRAPRPDAIHAPRRALAA